MLTIIISAITGYVLLTVADTVKEERTIKKLKIWEE